MNVFSKLREYYKPVLALVLVQAPVSFVWMTELTFSYTGMDLTNGFMVFDGLEVYHTLMYVLFGVNNVVALSLITSWKNEVKE